MPPETADIAKVGSDGVSTSARRTMVRRRAAASVALCSAMLALVIVPFVLFGDALEAIARDAMLIHKPLAAIAGFFLLAADIVLPVPSTVVVAVLGALLGGLSGTLVAAGGLTLGCLLGYWLGRRLGFGFAERTMGRADFDIVSGWFDRYGVVVLALCRPVPVLAEASIIAAGVTGLALRKALAVTALANIGFAGVYAALGAHADTMAGFLIAVGASMAVPFGCLLAAKILKSRRTSA